MSYAVKTGVSIEKSKGEIERMITRYGADRFMTGSDGNQALVAFQCKGKMVKFILHLPDRNDKKFKFTAARGYVRTDSEAYATWEQACRSSYRALCLCIKAKFEAIEQKISTFEQEFLAHFVMPGGQTFGEYAIPQLEEAQLKNRLPQLTWNG